MLTDIIILTSWITLLVILSITFIFKLILPRYKLTIQQSSFEELIMTLNLVINTEIELWEKDVFSNKGAITNSNFENFYIEISTHILDTLSPTFYHNIERYITEEMVASIVGRKTKEYLTTKIK